jgi:hypothetical protein
MKHCVLLVLVAAALTGIPGTASAKSCSKGYTHAVIGGEQKCLRRGEFCSHSKASQYRRYHFKCVSVRGYYRLEPSIRAATETSVRPTSTASALAASHCKSVTVNRGPGGSGYPHIGFIASHLTARATSCTTARRVARTVGEHVLRNSNGPFDACEQHRDCNADGFQCRGHRETSRPYTQTERCTHRQSVITWSETDVDDT